MQVNPSTSEGLFHLGCSLPNTLSHFPKVFQEILKKMVYTFFFNYYYKKILNMSVLKFSAHSDYFFLYEFHFGAPNPL